MNLTAQNLAILAKRWVDTCIGVEAEMRDKPYVWGGYRPDNGFDCSGLVLYVLNRVGVNWRAATQMGDLTANDLFTLVFNQPNAQEVYRPESNMDYNPYFRAWFPNPGLHTSPRSHIAIACGPTYLLESTTALRDSPSGDSDWVPQTHWFEGANVTNNWYAPNSSWDQNNTFDPFAAADPLGYAAEPDGLEALVRGANPLAWLSPLENGTTEMEEAAAQLVHKAVNLLPRLRSECAAYLAFRGISKTARMQGVTDADWTAFQAQLTGTGCWRTPYKAGDWQRVANEQTFKFKGQFIELVLWVLTGQSTRPAIRAGNEGNWYQFLDDVAVESSDWLFRNMGIGGKIASRILQWVRGKRETSDNLFSPLDLHNFVKMMVVPRQQNFDVGNGVRLRLVGQQAHAVTGGVWRYLDPRILVGYTSLLSDSSVDVRVSAEINDINQPTPVFQPYPDGDLVLPFIPKDPAIQVSVPPITTKGSWDELRVPVRTVLD